ncbi:sugar transferase [Isachenkonia alkalipeptolytica]|uniref:Sugar transferase n=1 Tax=Isachenkonia alkalipeptolytica TaxID=2565777 RepID=A0AA43XMW2_9CLOT|nr:sugar transferase [Isachenkonia alkalipeptolytica]NBG89620.1 sugar transferase [Isachenkonia alkalipeptolytica]
MYFTVKRYMDMILALLGLMVLAPVFILIMVLIKLDSKGPVFFRQKRVGRGKRHFYILKFRTMKIDTPKDMPTHLLKDPDQYITKMGKFLRKTSLDELPQILNIVKGEMSIVGPRPALWNQYDLIKERDKYGANDVPVGLTGWAQINGRDELPIEKKAKLDGKYVDNMGLKLDAVCFIGTFTAVLRRKGVIEGGTGMIGKLKARERRKKEQKIVKEEKKEIEEKQELQREEYREA